MKKFLTILCTVLFFASLQAQTFVPKPNSPIAKGIHPRLFVTPEGVAAMRERIKTHYRADFQNFVNDLDKFYDSAAGSAQWNEIFGIARSFALLYQIDPATIPGISARHTRKEYGQKAIAWGLHIAQNLDNGWTETHHGAKNLTTSDGGVASLALQVVYDWTHDLATLEQRRALAGRLITMWNNRYQSDKVKLENHYAANCHVYGGALCFYGDNDLGASYLTAARQMMDSFQDVFITRQLGVAAKLFEGSSDWVEGDGYAMDGYTGILLLAGAAGSALAENFFLSNPWIHDAPYYIYYNLMTTPYRGIYYFSQQNTSTAVTNMNCLTSAVMNMVAASLVEADPNLAGFAAWYCEKSPYGLQVDNYDYYEPHIYDFFYKFVFGTKHVPKKSPEEAGIPLGYHLGQMHAMRSDHSYEGATLIQFFSPQYWYQNGHNEEETGAINVHRFGTLAISAANTKNASTGIPKVGSGGKAMAQNNVFGLGPDKELSLEKGSISDGADTPQDFEIGANTHIGTVEAREHQPGLYDYVNYNYTRSYKAGSKATLARRALVYLRGPVNREFIVIMDRVQSAQEKYFVIHTPTDIEAVGGTWTTAGSGHWTSTAKTVKVVNRIDRSHGQMYLTSLLPQNATLHKFGGPGYEWVWADGSPVGYDGAFGEAASYLFSDHTLQIRSRENLFLTVIQIGDANTMGEKAPVEAISGPNWVGALIDKERLVLFSKDETPMTNLSCSISSNKVVKFFVPELGKKREYNVVKGGIKIATGTTGVNGMISFSDNPSGMATYTITLGKATSVAAPKNGAIPRTIELRNYPNPFNPSTTITFALPAPGKANLAIYNLSGQLIRTLISGTLASGSHNFYWDATDDGGVRVASGVYLCRLEFDGWLSQHKLLLTK
ncbi:MAG: T9SS type A sorting domain-containing protein [candidate division KSB1 bacterium]|nr:T9SS type A sorting domain-containing protein [candidate division KSB1 bacterium]MDZ7302593.1 T9SS type A sorting domain-containing protein [candidate division KSB1 bacterium]